MRYSHVTKDAEPPEVKAQNMSSRTMSEGCGEMCHGLRRFFLICFERDGG